MRLESLDEGSQLNICLELVNKFLQNRLEHAREQKSRIIVPWQWRLP
jgi:hypothetical protein